MVDRSPDSDYAQANALLTGTESRRVYVEHIPTVMTSLLGQYPNLCDIVISSLPEYEIQPYQFDFEDAASFYEQEIPLTWPETPLEGGHVGKHGTRGLVIRTYLNPDANEVLYHLRLFSRVYSDSKSLVMGFACYWQEFANYRERTVEYDTLKRVLEVEGGI